MRWKFQQISIFHCSGKAMPLLNPLISAMLWKIEIKKKLKSANWNSQNLKSRTNLESKLQRSHPILFKTGLVSACSIHVGTQQAGHCTKTADLVTFTEEIFNGKLRVLCSGFCSLQFLPLLCFSGKTERVTDKAYKEIEFTFFCLFILEVSWNLQKFSISYLWVKVMCLLNLFNSSKFWQINI